MSEASLRPKVRRRVFLISPDFQGAIVMRIVALTAAFAGLVIAGLAWTYQRLAVLPVEAAVRDRFAQAAMITAAVAVLLLLALGCYFVLLTHRIAGPAVRIKRGLVRLAEGDLAQRIQLRAGDYLEDLAGAYNRLAERMQQREARRAGWVRKAQVLHELIAAGEGNSTKAREIASALVQEVQGEAL